MYIVITYWILSTSPFAKGAVSTTTSAVISRAVGPIAFRCIGTEARLMDCHSSNSCSFGENAGVRCLVRTGNNTKFPLILLNALSLLNLQIASREILD